MQANTEWYRPHLAAINSLTKYPSIPTYHTLDPRDGRLHEERVEFPADQPVVITEKVDGTNVRLILLRSGMWFIASREDLLAARGDLVHNTTQGIVDAVRPLADRLADEGDPEYHIGSDRSVFSDDAAAACVLYLELYGGSGSRVIGRNARQYTGAGAVGYRLFDVLALTGRDLHDGLTRSAEEISAWRKRGSQTFLSELPLALVARGWEVPLVPRLATLAGGKLPESVDETHRWLEEHARTGVALDDGAAGRAEGVVLRTVDRGVIAKVRLESYERTRRLRQTQHAARSSL